MDNGGAFEDLLGTGEPLAARPRFNQRVFPGNNKNGRQKPVETKKVVTTVKTKAVVKQEINVAI